MAEAHRRKKQPVLVRRTLLDRAAHIALEHGLAAVTVQAVSEASGVTRGGFFHHFPSKQALVEAVVADMIERLDQDIDDVMAADDQSRGRFTRAYVVTTFADPVIRSGGQWSALYVAMLGDPSLRRLWSDWLTTRLARHRDTDGAPELEIVRLAADGAWLAHLFQDGTAPTHDIGSLLDRLLAMTRDR